MHTNSDVADTALRSEELDVGFAWSVVTRRKFFNSVGRAAVMEAPKSARYAKVGRRILKTAPIRELEEMFESSRGPYTVDKEDQLDAPWSFLYLRRRPRVTGRVSRITS